MPNASHAFKMGNNVFSLKKTISVQEMTVYRCLHECITCGRPRRQFEARQRTYRNSPQTHL